MTPETTMGVLAVAMCFVSLAACCVFIAIARDIWRREP
jgi:hypothetical protein